VAIPYTGIIKVHNKNCQQIPTISERSLEAYWVKKGYHLEKLTLKVDNRFGILAEIASRIHAVGGELKRADFNNGYLILILEITLEQRGLIKMALKLSSGVDAVEFNK
jgi:(p)ppGpp synthase/HD superfamily hydrolase